MRRSRWSSCAVSHNPNKNNAPVIAEIGDGARTARDRSTERQSARSEPRHYRVKPTFLEELTDLRLGRIFFRVSLAGALVAGPSIAALPDTAQAATAYQSATFNMAMGNSTYSTNYPNLHAQEIGAVLWGAGHGPWTISVQEVCKSQVAQLITQLQPYGLTASVYLPTQAQADASWSRCQTVNGERSRGVAVFTIGVDLNVDVEYQFPTQSSIDTGKPKPEFRKMACVKSDAYYFQFYGCSAHLTTWSDWPVAAKQAHEAFAFSLGLSAFDITGGDFNQNYGACWQECGTNEWWWTHDEMHLGHPGWNTSQPATHGGSNPSGKIDFLWAHRSHNVRFYAQPCDYAPYSDHDYCRGWFQFS